MIRTISFFAAAAFLAFWMTLLAPTAHADGNDATPTRTPTIQGDHGEATPTPAPTRTATPAATPTRTESAQASNNSSAATVVLEFVSATSNTVTWRVRTTAVGAMVLSAPHIASCSGTGGAGCEVHSGTAAGEFTSSGTTGQSILLVESFTPTGGSATVSQSVAYRPAGGSPSTVSATYQVSGAPALGWPLLVVFILVGIGGAWWVQRKAAPWSAR